MSRLLLAAFIFLSTLIGAQEPFHTILPPGAAAPEFDLPGVDGKNHTLKEFAAANVLVVIFTCNHCPTSQAYEERIKQLVIDYKGKGVAVVAISPNDPRSLRVDELGWTDLGDSFAEMKLRAKDHQFNFPYLYDGENEKVSVAYGPEVTPHCFIFDAVRKLRYVGSFDDSPRPGQVQAKFVRDAIDALLDGKNPEVTQTRAMGCSVKWAGKAESVKAAAEEQAAEPVSLVAADAELLQKVRQNETPSLRLVNFWSTGCAPCLAEFDDLVKIHYSYRRRGLEFISISTNQPDEQPAVLKFLQKKQASNINLIFGSKEQEKLIKAFDPDWNGALPYTLLIAPQGKVIYKQTGRVELMELKRAILKELNQQEPW